MDRGKVGVTTLVSARNLRSDGDGGDEDEELRRIESLPLGVVSVETSTVQVLGMEHDPERGRDVELRSADGKETGVNIVQEVEEVSSGDTGTLGGREGTRDGNRESTEKLVTKE